MPSVAVPRNGSGLLVTSLLLLTVLLVPSVLLPVASGAAGTVYVGGDPCGGGSTATWTTGDIWIMNRTTVVVPTCSLTIDPGAVVRADPNVHLYVDGKLWANGTQAQPIQFENNVTAVTPWAGIQFNASSQGSVSWSNFTRVVLAINVTRSSPAIDNNTILQASAGVYLDRSSSLVADNVVDGGKVGAFGIILTTSNATLARNRINGTNFGIRSFAGGNVTLRDNVITNTSGSGATIGVYLDNLTSATLVGNTIRTVIGRDAGPGGAGGIAVGILINDAATVALTGNTIRDVRGGRGGNGADSTLGPGNPGGPGGAAAGVALGSADSAVLQGNTLQDLAGNRGGNGGNSTIGRGGAGGAGGIAFALELFSSTGNVSYLGNTVHNVTGGHGGAGGAGTVTSNGPGGLGADAYGVFSPGGMNASISGNTITNLTGGTGGTSPVAGSLPGTGGSGGNVTAAIAVVNGIGTIHANQIANLSGGLGGDGPSTGGFGGNATGILTVGTSVSFNRTVVSYNQVSNVTGGTGGIGRKLSGTGGNASGIAGLHVNMSLTSNVVTLIHGGDGGPYAVITNQASGGGFAGALVFMEVPDGTSSLDTVQNVSPGASGGGNVPPPASYGVGAFFVGNRTAETHVAVTNGTVSGTSDFDLWVDNYTAVTTLNTPFSSAKVAVMSAGNLTVQNFLAVRAFWPNNLTTIWGARIVVKDNGVESYNQTSPLGSTNWIVVTNRLYIDSPVPRWNATQVTVSYQTYSFANNPRTVNMTASQTQAFTMVDTTAPTSSALALPAWTAARTFAVSYASSDGFGVGMANVTLWYKLNGTAWVAYGTQVPGLFGFGQFSFTAPADGTYEFATTGIDQAGNPQQPTPPAANNTWTIVDTVAPASHALLLPQYETSTTFTVGWVPDAGTTDVANYTIQVNTGSGWTDWLTNTTVTSASYTASAQGAVAFRTLAQDFAGNRESKSGNDTWTVVDTVAPQAIASTPTGNLSSTPTAIQITFSEPMNESAVEAAFSIAPSVPGSFTWSNGSTTLRFQPSSPFAPGTTYTVTLATGATDLAGNHLGQADVFPFATPAPPASGLSLADLWPWLAILAIAFAIIAFFLVRRRGAAVPEVVAVAPKPAPVATPPQREAAIDDVFLLYRRDGVLIKHETRRLRPDIDTDILSGMLTAVQQFVKDSFHGDDGEELNEMTVGQMHILIGRGKWLVLAATLTGGDIESMTAQIQRCVEDMETHNWDRLEDWDGDMDLAKALGPYLKKLIRSEYAA
jgi:hypothetical protein